MKIKLVDKKQIAEGTMMFSFEKPAGFEYRAGQNIDMTLIDPPETDAEGNMRTFSILTAPHEGLLSVATRMRDTAFKRVLNSAPTMSTEVEISEALGSFTLHNDTSKAAVFLIGGIGITPIRSLIFDWVQRQLPHNLFLFYSNRRPEDSAFLDELTALQENNPKFKLIATMTDMSKSAQEWSGETGYITTEMVKKYLPDTNAVWYLSGPPAMVKAMRGVLGELGADEDFIRTEEFSGY